MTSPRPLATFSYYYGLLLSLALSITALTQGLHGLLLLPVPLYFLWRSVKVTRQARQYAHSHPSTQGPRYSMSLTITLYIIALVLTLVRTYATQAVASGATP